MAVPADYVEYRTRINNGEVFRAGNIIKRKYVSLNGKSSDGFFIVELFTSEGERFYIFLACGERTVATDLNMRTELDSVTFS